MPPPGPAYSALHRVRRAHPLRAPMRRTADALDHASAATIRRQQEGRLRGLVRWAAVRSPFYRRWFAESGIDPRSIRGLDDLPVLPLLDRRHLMERPDEFACYPRRLMWPAHSAGTSGAVVTVHRTMGSSVFELVAQQRQWRWFGLPDHPRRVTLRVSDFRADQPDTVTRPVPGSSQLLVSSFHLTPADLPAILTAARGFGPDVVEGWPSSVTVLAGLMKDAGERLPVRGVLTSSEVLSDGQHQLLREVFAGPVIDHYGQTERVAMAGTCEAGGYHVFPDYGVVELLPVADELWEIVGTPLHNWGFPLFRYRTGDTVGPAPDGPCHCGRSFPLLGAIHGRLDAAFTARDGRPIPLPRMLVANLSGPREVQVVQRAPGRFEIRMVPGTGFDRAATRALALRTVERMVGPGQEVEFREMSRIPRSAGGKLLSSLVLDDLVGNGEPAPGEV